MFRFANIDFLYLLLLVPVMVVLFEWALVRRRKSLERFATPTALGRLIPEGSVVRQRVKFWLLQTAYVLMVLAVARPQMGSKLREEEREGVEIMLAIDVSNSMLADDFSPSRLERTKYAVARVIEGLDEERVGVIIFAGDAYVQLPITSDYRTAKNFVERISPTQVTKQGTAIGTAIDLATSAFSSTSEGSRVVVLVTDGENHEDDALMAAERAARNGVTIYTIGIGTPEGAPISIDGDYIRDEEGNIVVSKMDEATLRQIAERTRGAYVRATNANVGVEEIVGMINETEKAKLVVEIFDEYDEKFPIPLIAALVILMIEFVVLPRRNRLFAGFNLFGDRRRD